MLSWVLLDWAGKVIEFLSGDEDSILSGIVFMLFTFFIPLFYAILGLKKFMKIKWYWAIPAGLGAMVAVGVTNFCYRLIIFLVTFWAT